MNKKGLLGFIVRIVIGIIILAVVWLFLTFFDASCVMECIK